MSNRPQLRADDLISEAEFQATVIEQARAFGWSVYHTHDSRRSDPGFPDLTLARNGVALFMELKTMSGKLTAEQSAWLEELGANANLFRPSDRERITELLAHETLQRET